MLVAKTDASIIQNPGRTNNWTTNGLAAAHAGLRFESAVGQWGPVLALIFWRHLAAIWRILLLAPAISLLFGNFGQHLDNFAGTTGDDHMLTLAQPLGLAGVRSVLFRLSPALVTISVLGVSRAAALGKDLSQEIWVGHDSNWLAGIVDDHQGSHGSLVHSLGGTCDQLIGLCYLNRSRTYLAD